MANGVDAQSDMDAQILRLLQTLDDSGAVSGKESRKVEYKQSFHAGSLDDYAKDIAGFANATGGVLVFGVTNAPRRVVGIDSAKWSQVDPAKLSDFLRSHLEPVPSWTMRTLALDGKTIGYLAVEECLDRPVVCRQNSGDKLRAGAIYFRYEGQTTAIEYAELRALLDDVRSKERDRWMSLISQIAKIGTPNVALLDTAAGALMKGDGRVTFVFDRQLLQEIKAQFVVVEEGRFTECDGAPALKLVGQLVPSDAIAVTASDPEKGHPYLLRDLAEKTGLTSFQVQALIWKLKLKGDLVFNTKVRFGKSAQTEKYSEAAFCKIKDSIARAVNRDEYIRGVKEEYQRAMPRRTRARRKA